MNFIKESKVKSATRVALAVLLLGPGALQARAAADVMTGIKYEDLDTSGHANQVMEYNGKTYGGSNAVRGDVRVGNQSAAGLFDLYLYDIGSNELDAGFNADHSSGLRLDAKYQTLHHRIGYMRIGEIHSGSWLPKTAINLLDDPAANLMIRRTESEFGAAYVNPSNSARWLRAEYWAAEKYGSMSWGLTGNPNILRTRVDVNNIKQDFTLGAGTNIKDDSAVSVDLVHTEFRDLASKLTSPVDGGTGSNNNGGFIKYPSPNLTMNGTEMKFRSDLTKKVAVTGAFSGNQRVNERTNFKQNTVVGALNAAYAATKKLAFTGKLYLRAFEVVENAYVPEPGRGDAVIRTNTSQMDKTALRGEFIVNYRPVEPVRLKGSYKIEVTNRRDAPAQFYSPDRFYVDGYFVQGAANNEVARNDTKHTFNATAKADLPLGMGLEAGYTKMQANVPAFINMPNKQDDVTGEWTVPLPSNLTLSFLGGYLREKNTRHDFEHYSRTKNTYRAGLDWAATNKVFLGADASYETIRSFQEWYFGNGSNVPSATTSFHTSALTQTRNTVWGAHAKVNLPKGVVVMGNGTYTRSTVKTPALLRYTGGTLEDYTPTNVNIARGSVAVEYTPEKYKNLTARASYSVSDWVDKFDELNSGRYSVAQLGVSSKF